MTEETSDGDPPARARRGPAIDVGVAGPVSLELLLPRSLEAPGLARRALRQWIGGVAGTDELADDATLVVSEAVTNAVVHGCSGPRLSAELTRGRLRIEVHDTSRDPPVVRSPSAAPGGRGLRILAAVADAWGWSMTATGKVVWTEQRLAVPDARPAPSSA